MSFPSYFPFFCSIYLIIFLFLLCVVVNFVTSSTKELLLSVLFLSASPTGGGKSSAVSDNFPKPKKIGFYLFGGVTVKDSKSILATVIFLRSVRRCLGLSATEIRKIIWKEGSAAPNVVEDFCVDQPSLAPRRVTLFE